MSNKQRVIGEHWLARYGDLAVRRVVDPNGLSAEERAELRDLEMVSNIEGPEAVLEDAARALWDLLPQAKTADNAVGHRIADASAAAVTTECFEDVGVHFAVAALDRPKDPPSVGNLEVILRREFDRDSDVVRLVDTGMVGPHEDYADELLFERQGNYYILIGIAGVQIELFHNDVRKVLQPGDRQSYHLNVWKDKTLQPIRDPESGRITHILIGKANS